ncbi:thiolase-like protein [Aspergillus minisclerotigenes]|uniref:Thiolase-like protein n=1 Tax=Aspergillus minisclerotigenes TaxID=656917 RepID=A0A5N6JAC7_9EURO|nr:thiolase-like protein [Aspergillus minisclerotigenes]
MAGYSNGQTRRTDPTKIATFFGQCNDWHVVGHRKLRCDAYTLQAVQRAFGPGRLAFQFNWEGPTYALDSACAATSSCIHLACMSLTAKDIDMAVAGAANTYRDDADGYCRADFSGAVVLKRLYNAITFMTTSDAAVHERLFHKVLRKARVTPEDISYVEMHGTGTQVGDKAEMGAVSSVFLKQRDGELLPVGAIKANIGHSGAVSCRNVLPAQEHTHVSKGYHTTTGRDASYPQPQLSTPNPEGVEQDSALELERALFDKVYF